MKKLFAVTLPLFFLFTSAFSLPASVAADKVYQVFNETFKDVQNLKWFVIDKEYIAYFTQNNIRTKVSYDDSGHFLRSRRSLTTDYLPLNLLCQITGKYNGKVIKEVAEVVEGNEIFYGITIEDDYQVSVIEVFPNGTLKSSLKFKKQQ